MTLFRGENTWRQWGKELAPGKCEKDYFRFWSPFDKCAGRPKCNVYHKRKVFARKASLCLVRSAFASSLTASLR